MATQPQPAQVKPATKISMPAVKADIFASVAKGRRIHRIAPHEAEAALDECDREEARLLREAAPKPPKEGEPQ